MAVMHRLGQRLWALILSVAADGGGLGHGDFSEPTEGADVWSVPTQGQPTVLQALSHSAVTRTNAVSNARMRTNLAQRPD